MKIGCEIVEVSNNGDRLRIVMEGKADSAAEHSLTGTYEINIPSTATNMRAYRVGRKVVMRVDPV